MDLDMAKQLLGSCVKYENRDHAFGDMEVEWYDGENHVGSGYFGGGQASVTVNDLTTNNELEVSTTFKDVQARVLLGCFASAHVERNDETGPEEFVQDKVMPALTLDGVRKELTGE